MEEERTQAPPGSGKKFPARGFLFWVFFVAFVLGGMSSGALALARVVDSSDLPGGSLAARILPLDLLTGKGDPTTAPDWNNRERINILILGIDRRPDELDDQPTRTDTILVLTLDPFSNTAGMLSIPRDLWVPIPLNKNRVIQGRVNTAYVEGILSDYPGGGVALARETIQYNFGIRIHYHVVVDFDGFERMVDAVGGVTVDVKTALVDSQYPTPNYGTMRVYIPAGEQHLNGEQALQYARSRHQDSDFGRIQRQQQVVMAVRKRLLELDALPRIPAFWSEFQGSVNTDLNLGDIIRLARVAKGIDENSIVSRAVEGPYVSDFVGYDGASLLMPVRARIRDLVNDVFPDYRKEQEAARIQVLNGTATPGLASRTARQLKDLGFEQVIVGDAERHQATTEIMNLSGKDYTAYLVASSLRVPRDRVKNGGNAGANGDGSAGGAAGEPVDIQVILGDDAR